MIIPKIKRPIITFGIHKDAEVRATELHFEQNRSYFNLMAHGNLLGELSINVPGTHNV